MFSFWPEVKNASSQHTTFSAAGCLSNSDLGGSVLDTTITSCRDLIWNTFLEPNYYSAGVSAYWLDETDGEGTGGGDGTHGYDTSFGPAAAYSQLWVNTWLSTFSRPVALLGEVPPLVLARGLWAGGQRYGVVLWSSDIQSSFEQLTSMVPQGVHASLSGVPWWTTDVGGYGCSFKMPNDSPYMKELIVRWYQFGLFCVRGLRLLNTRRSRFLCIGAPSSLPFLTPAPRTRPIHPPPVLTARLSHARLPGGRQRARRGPLYARGWLLRAQ